MAGSWSPVFMTKALIVNPPMRNSDCQKQNSRRRNSRLRRLRTQEEARQEARRQTAGSGRQTVTESFKSAARAVGKPGWSPADTRCWAHCLAAVAEKRYQPAGLSRAEANVTAKYIAVSDSRFANAIPDGTPVLARRELEPVYGEESGFRVVTLVEGLEHPWGSPFFPMAA